MRYWLSVDVGLRGDYEKLYEWLDRIRAQECGGTVATFNSPKTREKLAKELARLVDRHVRLYLIQKGRGGVWVVGDRREPPWAGYAPQTTKGGLQEDV